MNRLAHALNAWHTDGGYLVLRRTSHPTRWWQACHVLHVGGEGLTHYAPGATLGHPVQSLYGFDGVVWERDLADAAPMPLRGIVLSAALGAAGVLLWAIKRMWRRSK
ncbi:MAG: hypothetical protein RBT67_02755 [Thauera sp.]|jgi:hypothetical protein|nr:hypothetical protein [Thauera sp.]